MKEKMIEVFELKFVKKTNWNEIYYNDTHVYIFNFPTKTCKIKPR